MGPLARWGVTPNQLTTARLLTGLGGAATYALGLPAWGALGSALLLVSFTLDRLDGELARATGACSPWGHKYDLACDAAVNGAILAGIGLGVGPDPFAGWGALLGLVAAAGVAAVFAMVAAVELRHGPRAAEIPSRGVFDPDDAMVLAPVLVLAGAQVPLLATAAAATPIGALALAWHLREKLLEPAPGPEPGD